MKNFTLFHSSHGARHSCRFNSMRLSANPSTLRRDRAIPVFFISWFPYLKIMRVKAGYQRLTRTNSAPFGIFCPLEPRRTHFEHGARSEAIGFFAFHAFFCGQSLFSPFPPVNGLFRICV